MGTNVYVGPLPREGPLDLFPSPMHWEPQPQCLGQYLPTDPGGRGSERP